MRAAHLPAVLIPFVASLLALGSTACSTPTRAAEPAVSTAAPKWKGVLAPAEYEAVSIWPDVYAGELFVLEVMPQGSVVAKGDVLALLETKALDEQLRKTELDLRTAAVRHQALVARNAMAEEAAAAGLERTRAALERAQLRLSTWNERELALAAGAREISELWEAASIEDQEDELEQLLAMYEGDELVDATEDLVLKRNRRRLGLTEKSNALSEDRRKLAVEVEERLEGESREEDVRTKELALAHLIKQQGLERSERDDAAARSEAELEQQRTRFSELRGDRDKLVVRAPRTGVLLHGRVEEYRPGAGPTKLEAGARLTARQDFLLVANPERMLVQFVVPEADVETARRAREVTVVPTAIQGATSTGRLQLAEHPLLGREGAQFEARVELANRPAGLDFGLHAEVSPKLPEPGTAESTAPEA